MSFLKIPFFGRRGTFLVKVTFFGTPNTEIAVRHKWPLDPKLAVTSLASKLPYIYGPVCFTGVCHKLVLLDSVSVIELVLLDSVPVIKPVLLNWVP